VLYARQAAYLQRPAYGQDDKLPKELLKRTRYEMREKHGKPLNLPDVQSAHLLTALNSLGWVQPSGMGVGMLSAVEIGAWCQFTGTVLDEWEFHAIRAASAAYASQSQNDDAEEPNPGENDET
jgi:hypothetical protein